MKTPRRQFLKGLAGGVCLGALGEISSAAAATKKERLPEALGILYDATLCVGCQACMVGCKEANKMPPEFTGDQKIWDNPLDLSDKTLNLIRKYENGTAAVKDAEENGYAFIKRQCMHCVDPGCVSACPPAAMRKDTKTGIVTWDKDRCIGCRYCQVACPYNIPKFEWHSAFPYIVKCQLCSHLIAKGGVPGCCGACPTGASLFGPVTELLAEARKRLSYEPGKYYRFPISDTKANLRKEQAAAKYVPKIYGEEEAGGTQVLLLSGVPHAKLGLPELPAESYASLAESIQHTLYKGMLLPLALFAGLIFVVKKRGHHAEE